MAMKSTDKWYLEKEEPSLRLWVFSQMALGAGYGALVFFGVIAFVLILVAISYLLPEDPYAALEGARPLLTMLG
jgi:hypothetical protein